MVYEVKLGQPCSGAAFRCLMLLAGSVGELLLRRPLREAACEHGEPLIATPFVPRPRRPHLPERTRPRLISWGANPTGVNLLRPPERLLSGYRPELGHVRPESGQLRSSAARSCGGAGRVLIAATRMSLPRQALPGQFYMIACRCTQRQFLLRPDAATEQRLHLLPDRSSAAVRGRGVAAVRDEQPIPRGDLRSVRPVSRVRRAFS
jgi:hypothetical protein